MFVRKSLAGVVAATLAGSVIALSAGSASAAVDPDDTTFAPTSADLVGVGSDATQHAMKLFADAWNASGRAPVKMASYAATSGGDIALPSGSIVRPKNSGEGRAKLYGTGNNADVDFARSSGAINATEASEGLQMFPFALDTLVVAVSNKTASNAPASLTVDQILKIYKGEITNWSDLGGKSGTIVPLIPNDGSGTRSFFLDQLKAANGGVAVTPAASWKTVQEHDPAPIQNDANAIGPISKGRAGLTNGAVRVEQGWSKDRAMYTVVRGASLADPLIQGAFGEDGALCSTEVRPLLEAAGFQQLATPDNGGVCGAATQAATTNFAVNDAITTTTRLKATSPKAKSAKLVATVTAATSPSGSVDFFEGDEQVASDVPLVSGAATVTLKAPVGEHTYTAVFDGGEGSSFEASEDDATVTVTTTAKVSESFPATVAKGKKAAGTVSVKADGATATGKVTIKEGSKTLGSAKLKNGKASFSLKLSKGKHPLKAVYAGSSKVAGATTSFSIKQK